MEEDTDKWKILDILCSGTGRINIAKMSILPNVRPETIKLLEENTGGILFDANPNHSKIFYDPPPRVMKKTKTKWDLIKLKSFCTAKETINKVKRKPSEWEDIIPNESTDKGLISKTNKQLMQLNTRKKNKKL